MSASFVVGKTYQTRSICDHECLITYTVVDRTPKTVKMVKGYGNEPLKLNGDNRKVETFRISERGTSEFIRPWGRYSMSPILEAYDVIEVVGHINPLRGAA